MASPPPPPPLLSFPVDDDAAHSSSLDNIKPTVLIIILILSITIFVSVSICLILRLLNGRCLRHHSRSPTTISTSTTTTRVSPEQPPPSSFLDQLPIFTFSSVTRRSAASVISGDCAVCLSKFERDDQLRLLPLCCHAFHADCIDTWIAPNQTCPLCRSPLFSSDADLMKLLRSSSSNGGGNGGSGSFRIEIGSVSRRQGSMGSSEQRTSYSVGSFDYVVDDDSEVSVNRTHRRNMSDKDEFEVDDRVTEATLAAEVGAGRGWLKDYVDRLSYSISSRSMSFRSSGRFFTGSSRRDDIIAREWDVEANRVGEEISELFRWISGV